VRVEPGAKRVLEMSTQPPGRAADQRGMRSSSLAVAALLFAVGPAACVPSPRARPGKSAGASGARKGRR
jgi:hypothetical protein